MKWDTVLTEDQLNHLYKYFRLPVFWSGVFNNNGYIKGNRTLEKSVYTPIAEPLLYFIYNEDFWGYKEVTNSTTGKTWMDRNLGASRVATSKTDSLAYGDLFQFGRLDDGHQKRDSLTTDVLSPTDIPGHAKFIKSETTPYDWRVYPDLLLWKASDYKNLPAPVGWRLPTEVEYAAEINSWDVSADLSDGAFDSNRKWTLGGRRLQTASLNSVGSIGYYYPDTNTGASARYLRIEASPSYANSIRSQACSVRLIKI